MLIAENGRLNDCGNWYCKGECWKNDQIVSKWKFPEMILVDRCQKNCSKFCWGLFYLLWQAFLSIAPAVRLPAAFNSSFNSSIGAGEENLFSIINF